MNKKDDFVMNQEEYIESRLEDQIKWYSNKSQKCQKTYKRLQIFEIIIAALSPVIGCFGLALSDISTAVTITISFLGAIIAIIESAEKLGKYHENWIQYRYISEILKHEKYLYLTHTDPYNDENAFAILVQRVERAISSENVNWVGINNEKPKQL